VGVVIGVNSSYFSFVEYKILKIKTRNVCVCARARVCACVCERGKKKSTMID